MSYLMHKGTPHEGNTPHSGRHPWGSGEHAFQRAKDFMSIIEKRKHEGIVSDKDLAASMNMTTREFKALRRYNNVLLKQHEDHKYKAYLDQGLSVSEIAKKEGVPSSTVRSRIKNFENDNEKQIVATVDLLKKEVDKKKYVDIGSGVANGLGIGQHRFESSVQALVDQGYVKTTIKVEQAGIPGNDTTVMVLAKPGTTKDQILADRHNIGLITERFESPNAVETIPFKPVKSISSKKVYIRYAEEGGEDKDGVIELRPGAEGLSLGSSRYAQVRIGVDGTHFLKGMAMYSDSIPKGYDIVFNTNKKKGVPMLSSDPDAKQVLKPMKFDDPTNPFGAAIQRGGQMGYVNIVNREGDWGDWSKTLASQFLSKQPYRVAKEQLKLAELSKKQEFDEILSLSHNSLKKQMLQDFADSCDKAAVNLKAHAFAGQGTHVILPLTDIKPTDIYAPGYENGDSVVLIRYPHAGTFEIPRLRVNNKNPQGKKLLSDAQDAVGIHPSVAGQLSGADFDGDTVLVIRDNGKRIRNEAPYPDLQNFDPKKEYGTPKSKNFKPISEKHKNQEMGVVSNLISDMTLQLAPPEHIIPAVKYSMVVIDAYKHKLDWKQAKKDCGIDELRKIYQVKDEIDPKTGEPKYGGATTIISRAKSSVYENPPKYTKVDPETGEKIVVRDPQRKRRKEYAMANTNDANTLVSAKRHPMELIYADYANYMKAMANQARLADLKTPTTKRSPEAAKEYAAEVATLKAKINDAVKHRPFERKAQLIADYKATTAADDIGLSRDEMKKYRARYLTEARESLGGSKPPLTITDKEWKAIEKGAVGSDDLKAIFQYADQDKLKSRAMPREKKGMTSVKIARAKALIKNDYSLEEVAKQLGVSVGTLKDALY